MKSLNIIFPVYNEEIRLKNGIEKANKYLSEVGNIDYILTIVDNASTDATEKIALQLCKELSPQVRYLKISAKGVGAAFRAGVAANQSDIVGYMDVDLSTDLRHVLEMYKIFCEDSSVKIVNASRWNKNSDTSGRKLYRNITSIGLVWLLKLCFRMRSSDAICGFKFFRKETAESLIAEAGEGTNGWFYLIELLLRAERNNIEIVELPVRWVDDSKNSTVRTLPLIREYLHQIILLKSKLRRG